MNKMPYIERPDTGRGFTGKCAYLWALFLMEEADIEDDHMAYAKWRTLVDRLSSRPGHPQPTVHYNADLEDAIKEYIK